MSEKLLRVRARTHRSPPPRPKKEQRWPRHSSSSPRRATLGRSRSEDQASKIQLLNPQQLYELWEKQHWLSHEIDFSPDKEDWANLTDEERDYFIWGLSAFFIGEERVTTQFSGLVMAYEDESEEAFLTTQQVDEARHSQFFDRFYREVIGIDDPSWEKRLGRVREELNDSFVKLFDEVLVEANQAPDRRPEQPRGEGRLLHDLPHGDRGDAGADRPELHHRPTSRRTTSSPGSSRDSGRSPATSTATSPTGPGS